mmetsp:Transcript_30146/g.54651  ORF Transcript_30146/g.54651 Transcript_30146/m.54651 type:complete len:656 (+) Transcript_30146:78-2045(+)
MVGMKAWLAAFTCLLAWQPTSAAKLTTHNEDGSSPWPWPGSILHSETLPESWCPGNRYPAINGSVDLIIHGKMAFDDVGPDGKLKQALIADPEWLIGKLWTLELEVTNNDDQDHTFTFAGGNDEGFFRFSVQKGAVNKKVSITNKVMAEANHSRMELRTDELTKPYGVKLSKICLRPVTCEYYFKHAPEGTCQDPYFNRTANPELVFGDNRSACCHELHCTDYDACSPNTSWQKRPDYDTARGSTTEYCCMPLRCKDWGKLLDSANASGNASGNASANESAPESAPESFCNSTNHSTKWKAKEGDLLGSTPEECCDPKPCSAYKCSSDTLWKHKPTIYNHAEQVVLRQGSTDEECCDALNCSTVNCTITDKWEFNENSSTAQGSTPEECCTPLMCADFNCTPSTEWEARGVEGAQGSTNQACCAPKLCKLTVECDEHMQWNAHAKHSGRGSTQQECCEPKACMLYNCSDENKWSHKSDQDENDMDRIGYSDEECCDPIYCITNDCLPETKWKKRNESELNGTQGSKSETCCDPKYCHDYNCTGDFPPHVKSTKWYKRVDTNHHKWQGSTDEECCMPKYCSQFYTNAPDKWERLPDDGDKPRQGSTEQECYKMVFCGSYACEGESLKRKADADKVQGSTDADCCEPVGESPPLGVR